MIVAFENLLPSFLLIALGLALARTPILPAPQWEGVERLNYYVLYPMLLFVSVVRADLGDAPVAPMAAAMALGVAVTAGLMWLTKPLLQNAFGVDEAGFTSHLQGAIRYHSAVALAVAGALLGADGLALAALAVVEIVPLVNVLSVAALARLADGGKPRIGSVLKEIAINPMIVATLAGALVNATGLPVYRPLVETFDLLGKGALGLALLLVGVGIQVGALAPRWDVAVNAAIKLAFVPAAMAAFAIAFGVEGAALAVVVISGCAPTASSGYVLARRMGGDAELMATLIAAQMVFAFATMPVALRLAGAAAAAPA